jgi:hypothetical protein
MSATELGHRACERVPRCQVLPLARLYVGLAGFGLSIALMVKPRLGLDPWDVLRQGIARQLGVQTDWVEIGVGTLVLLAWIPLRQRPGGGGGSGGQRRRVLLASADAGRL